MPWRLFLVTSIFLAACAAQPLSVIVSSAGDRSELLPVFVGNTKAIDRFRLPSRAPVFSPLSLATYIVADPDNRETGDLPMASGLPNPEVEFAIAEITPYHSQTEFMGELNAALRERPAGQRTIMVYVHGFNLTFSTGLFRTAQIVRDLKIEHIPAYFSWPSVSSSIYYPPDQKAFLQAQQELKRFLEALVGAGAEGIVLLGHSLGADLVLETLATMQSNKNMRTLETIEGVFLASPDISVDEFRTLASSAPALPEPVIVFSSSQDWLLWLSSLRPGASERLGRLTDSNMLADLNVLLVDLSGYREGYSNHRVVFSSPQFLADFEDWASRSDHQGRAFRVLMGK